MPFAWCLLRSVECLEKFPYNSEVSGKTMCQQWASKMQRSMRLLRQHAAPRLNPTAGEYTPSWTVRSYMLMQMRGKGIPQLEWGDIGVRVVQADEGCASLGFGVLDHLPVVLGGRYVRLDPCKVDVRGAVALVRVLKDFMGACCHDQVTAKPGGILGQK